VARREIEKSIAKLDAEIGARPVPTDELTALNQQLEKAQETRATLQAEYRTAIQRAAEGTKNAARADTLRASITTAEAEAAELGAATAALKATQAELAGFTGETEGEDMVAEVGRLRENRAAATATIEAMDKQITKARAEFNRALEQPCCPTCGTTGTAWHQQMEARYQAEEAEATAAKTAAERQYQAAGKKLEKAQATLNERQKNARVWDALSQRVKDLQAAVDKAQRATENLPGLRAQLQALGDTAGTPAIKPAGLDEADAYVAELRDTVRRVQLVTDRTKLQAQLAAAEIVGDEDTEQRKAALEDEVEATEERVEALKLQQQQAANQKADQKRLQEAQEAREAAAATVVLVNAVKKAIGAEREELIRESFGPLLDTANTFTAGILPTPLEYHEGEIGRFQDGQWIDVDAFGGAFTAATYAGIQSALGVKSPARLVIVDELGRFDTRNKSLFLRNVRAAIDAGKIEQFVGMDVTPEDYTAEVVEGYGLHVVAV
jgi:hypothetical protein